ncbi:MAG: hypothetical protein HYW63_00710 [Candidatus Levybacteria bacterium]|nr:hypothetical protein [Candidatus Levybacteria bacterium]
MAFPQEAPRFDAPRTVLATVDPSPVPTERPLYPTLRFYPNGLIDLEPINGKSSDSSHVNGIEYEELGMRVVDQMLPDDHFAIGAHLLDAATIRTDLERGGNGRPDLMVFDRKGELKKMFEFKRALRDEELLRRKLLGISSLLGRLRANPMRLGELIQEATGQEILPDPIFIPPDHELEPVVFISSSERGDDLITADGTALRGSFMTIPLTISEP